MKSKTAPVDGLLDELQSTLANGSVSRRIEQLRRVTDLFLSGTIDYSDQQIALFDDVFQCLIERIEVSARALLAKRLATTSNAPRGTVRVLAFDDTIEVAGPVLSQSERLDEAALIEAARSKSQAHLLAISIRKVLSRSVTDVLVKRGNAEVVQSTVKNPGADFSKTGYDRLIKRAADDDDLATGLALRPTLPRHLYLKLLAKASDTVRQRLEAAHPKQAADVPTAVREAARRARTAPAGVTKQTEIARGLVESLHEDGRIDQDLIIQFAEQGRFDETNAAIAALANVTVATAENMMLGSRAEGIMILAKVAALSWSAVETVIRMHDELSGGEPTDLGACKATYERLRSSTAQQVIRFHRMQQNAQA
jgi:uncharacterized protein (DUF2336 family)